MWRIQYWQYPKRQRCTCDIFYKTRIYQEDDFKNISLGSEAKLLFNAINVGILKIESKYTVDFKKYISKLFRLNSIAVGLPYNKYNVRLTKALEALYRTD